MKDFYKEIDTALKTYEDFKPYHTRDLDWICRRIDWCWKWKKISKSQMEKLSDRVVLILERR